MSSRSPLLLPFARVRVRSAGLVVAFLAAWLLPHAAAAYPIEGTADIEVLTPGSPGDRYQIVTLAGVDVITARTGGQSLLLFAEYGPSDVVESDTVIDWAGQIWIEVPMGRLIPGATTPIDVPSEIEVIQYVEWVRGGVTVFDGRAAGGWLDVQIELRGQALVAVDVVFSLEIDDGSGGGERQLQGVVFGQRALDRPVSGVSEPRRRVVRRSGGCDGDAEVVVYYVEEDDYYYYEEEQEPGCAGDEVESNEVDYGGDESGCAGDSVDSGSADEGPSCADDETSRPDDTSGDADDSETSDEGDLSCAGDDTGDGSSSDDGSDDSSDSSDSSSEDDDLQCAGDDIERDAVEGSVLRVVRPARARRAVSTAARQIHLWGPLLFLLYARRRWREGGRSHAPR